MPEKFDIYQYLNLALKHKSYLIFSFLGVSLLFTIFAFLMTEVYQAKTLVLVQREVIQNPLGKGALNPEDANKKLAILKQVITSRRFVQETMNKVGIDARAQNPGQYERLLSNTIEKITITLKEKSGTFEIAYQDKDPKTAAFFVNTITGIYTDFVLSGKQGQSYTAFQFLKEQIKVYEQKLVVSEKALREFKETHFDYLPENRNNNLARLNALSAALTQIDFATREAQIRRNAVVSGASVSARGGSVTLSPQTAFLIAKKNQLSQLLSRYTDKHPDIIALRQEIAALESGIGSETAISGGVVVGGGPLASELQRANLELDALAARKVEIENEMKLLEEKVKQVPALEQELTTLTRDYNVNTEFYQTLLTKLEETNVFRDLENSTSLEIFEVLDPAVVPVKPIKPDRPKIIILGMILGLAVGAGVVFLKENMDTSLKTVKEAKEFLQGIGFSVLAVIPKSLSGDQPVVKRTPRELLRDFYQVALVGAYLVVAIALIVIETMRTS
ncbi:MAG: XrtA system polysaccharide chain length determinant [Deltaproteobacteria bacterium]